LAAEFTVDRILTWKNLPPADRIREALVQQLILTAVSAPDLGLRMDASKYLLGVFSPQPAPAPYGPESPQVGAAIASMNSILVAAGIQIPNTSPSKIELETEHVGAPAATGKKYSQRQDLEGQEPDDEEEDDDTAV
jgi:hypothetical protein